MEANLPTHLKIGAHSFRVIFATHWEGGNDGDLGHISKETNTIYILKGIPASQQFATLIHEVFHALNNEISHELLDSFSEQLSQVLWDNEIIKDDLR